MKKVIYVIFLLTIVMVLVACGSNEVEEKNNEINKSSNEMFSGAFVTGSAGGVYNVLGGGMTKIINDNYDNIKLSATTPPSVSQIPLMLHEGQAVLGFGMVDMIQRALNGEGEFDQKHENVRAVMGLYDNVMSAVVSVNSDINNISEVSGKTVGVSSESTYNTVVAIFEEAGVSEDEVDWQFLSYNEQVSALKDGVIDVAILTAYPKSGLVDELNTTLGIKFLEVDSDTKEAFNQKYPYWLISTIPAGTYNSIDYDAEFYAVYTGLYAHSDVPNNVVYDIVEGILENQDEISAVHPAGQMIVPEKTAEYIEKGFINLEHLHPGAKKYFEEKNIIN